MVSAQTVLPNRDDPAWVPIGSAAGTEYFIHPDRLEQEHSTVWFVMRAIVPPSPTGDVNTVVARGVVDCATSEIGVGTREYYSETRGLQHRVEAEDPQPGPVTDPGQSLVIQYVCAE